MDDDGESGARPNGRRANGSGSQLYRLNSNQSRTSVFEDVEMAHDEVPHPSPFPSAIRVCRYKLLTRSLPHTGLLWSDGRESANQRLIVLPPS